MGLPQVELGAYEHALAWWAARGEELRVSDSEAAIARAASSAGVHFSFEKVDHVTRSTICGLLPSSRLSEVVTHRHELIAFAISDETLAEARETVSGESEAERAAAEAEAQRTAADTASRAASEAAAERMQGERAAEHHRRLQAKLAAKRAEGQQQKRQCK